MNNHLHRPFLIALLAAALFAGWVRPTLAQTAEANPETTAYVPGEVLAGVRQDEVSSAAVLALQGVELIETFSLAGLDDSGSLIGLRLGVAEGDEWSTITALTQSPAVVFAEPNWLVRAAEPDAPDESLELETIETPFAVNDPFYATDQWYMQRIGASRAWQLAGSSGDTIRVAVIDSGVDAGHPQLQGRLLGGWNYISPSQPPIDDYGHGTHVAGVIAAKLNDASGTAGLITKVQIDPRKVLNSNGGGTILNVATAIREAVDDGADIINLSLEVAVDSAVLRSAVQYAAVQGALQVAAAGNCIPGQSCPPPVRWPAAYPEVIAVAATDFSNNRASYSAVGSEIELAAPGGVATSSGAIYSTWSIDAAGRCPTNGGNFRIVDGGAYCNANGTSMAAGVVSGVAALVWSRDEELTSEDVRRILNVSATPLAADDTQVGSGLVNAARALRYLKRTDVEPSADVFAWERPSGTPPFTFAVTLHNPSLETQAWRATLPPAPWIRFAGSTERTREGESRFDRPGRLLLTVDPGQLAGVGSVALNVQGSRSDGSRISETVTFALRVESVFRRQYLPAVTTWTQGSVIPAGPRWEMPNSGGRTVRSLTDDSDVRVILPFTFSVKGTSHAELRLFSDGYIAFPASAGSAGGDNRCLPNAETPSDAIYGWWADLDPSASGAQVSTFQPDGNRFVIEFLDVPSAASVSPAYTVSFQIVLARSGEIALNYRATPALGALAPRVTIGVEAAASRFFNLLFCQDGVWEIGVLPQGEQSFVLTGEDLY